MSERDDDFRRILVVCTRQIGDVLLTTPMIRAARQRWPGARIDVLGFAGTLGMLRGNPDVASTIEVTPGSGWLRSLPLIARLWRRYDLALVTQRSDRAHLYGWIAARRRAGLVPGNRSLGWWKHLILQHAFVVNGEETHAAIEKLVLLSPWVGLPSRLDVVPTPPAALPSDVEAALQPGFVVMHVPSIARFKQWPATHFRQVIADLTADGRQVVLTGSPSPHDRAQVDAVLGAGDPARVLDVAGRLDFAQLSGLLRRAALFIGPDTSVTHLAAAHALPLIALYGPTHPQVWAPWPQGESPARPAFERRAMTQESRPRFGRVVLMQGPPRHDQPADAPDCVPCRQEGCERWPGSRADCLDGLLPDRVTASARALLAPPVPRADVDVHAGGSGPAAA